MKTIEDETGTFKTAYSHAAAEENGVTWFKATGTEQLNSQVFPTSVF